MSTCMLMDPENYPSQLCDFPREFRGSYYLDFSRVGGFEMNHKRGYLGMELIHYNMDDRLTYFDLLFDPIDGPTWAF